ncbi:MAG: hypothetical protein ACHQHN_02995 [Sphingobacteriales bacterium]
MTKELLFDYISSASGLFPVIAFLYNYKHLDKTFKIIAAFFIVAVLFDIVLRLWTAWGIGNNYPVIHVFVIINIIFFGLIYYKAFFIKKVKRLTIILSAIAFLIAVYFTKNLNDYPSEGNTASSIVFIILSLIYFYQLLSRQEFVLIEKQGLFWFNAGVLFYFSINIFLFMLFPKIPKDQQASYYIINNITNIIANLLYTTGLLCQPQKTT